MPSKLRKQRQEEMELEQEKAELKAKNQGKQISGGEASKRAKEMDALEIEQEAINAAEGQDNRKGNIGPSGQGNHRGGERVNRQTIASGRPDHSAASPDAPFSAQ